jgi:hypothetical protein
LLETAFQNCLLNEERLRIVKNKEIREQLNLAQREQLPKSPVPSLGTKHQTKPKQLNLKSLDKKIRQAAGLES